jgi:hypothetical protein
LATYYRRAGSDKRYVCGDSETRIIFASPVLVFGGFAGRNLLPQLLRVYPEIFVQQKICGLCTHLDWFVLFYDEIDRNFY